jgi:MYXO-CTERM domain-containing protein
MRRHGLAALALAVAAPAAAQFRPDPMVIPLGASGEVAIGAVTTGSPGADVLSFPPARLGAPVLRPYRHLLARPPLGRAVDPGAVRVAAAFLGPPAPGALADLVFPNAAALSVSFGADPGVLRTFPAAFSAAPPGFGVAHLLAREGGDAVVAPVGIGDFSATGTLEAADLSTGALAERRAWPISALLSRPGVFSEVLPLRLSATARALGVDDLAIPGVGEVQLLLHQDAPGGPGLAGLRLVAVKVGDHVDATRAPWLPAGMGQGDVHGAAPLDVDFDGVPDLVLSLAIFTEPSLAQPRGLVWIRSTGVLADYGDPARRWGDLRAHPDLPGITDPVTLRPVTVEGAPGLAVWDRAADAIFVVTSDARARRLRQAWRGSAAGVQVSRIWLADVAGSPLPDLVAAGARVGTSDLTLLVYPDAGDAWPALAWSPGSPGTAARGLDHPIAVDATDADGPLTVEWLLGDREDPPAATGAAWTVPGALLCSAGSELPVQVRATDDLGVFAELAGSVPVVLAPPSLRVSGATPAGRLPLPPGGTAAVLEGEAWTGCGRPVTFTWGATGIPAGAIAATEAGTTWARETLDLPEALYPALLAGAPEVTLAARDDLGLESPRATLPLDLDATGVAQVSLAADRTSLGDGELAVLRATVESRLAVPLPGVTVALRLAGLAAAGPARIVGATGRDAGGGAVVLDALPPAGTAVVVELPVRATGARGASTVTVRSAGGHLLAPSTAPRSGEAPAPGCGCGAGAPGGLALLALGALARRRRAT